MSMLLEGSVSSQQAQRVQPEVMQTPPGKATLHEPEQPATKASSPAVRSVFSSGPPNAVDAAAAAVTSFLSAKEVCSAAAALASELLCHSDELVYLGEAVYRLRQAGAGTRFASALQGGPWAGPIGNLLVSARIAADSTAAALAAITPNNLGKALDGDRTFGERYLFEMYTNRTRLLTGVSSVDGFCPPAQRGALGDVLGACVRDGLVPVTWVVDLEARNGPIGNEWQDPLVYSAITSIGSKIEECRKQLADAEAALARLDKQLADQLAEIGPAITTTSELDERQLDNYVRAFKASNSYEAAQQRVTLASVALEHELGVAGDSLEHASTVVHNPLAQQAGRDQLFATYTTIALSDTPAPALEWVASHRADPTYASAAERLNTVETIACDTLSSTLTERLRQELARSQGASPIDAIISVATEAKSLYGKVKTLAALKELPDLLFELKAVWQAYKAGNDATEAVRLAKAIVDLSKDSPKLVKLFGVVGGMVGAAFALGKGGDIATMTQNGKKLFDSMVGFQKLVESANGTVDQKVVKEAAKGLKNDLELVDGLFSALGVISDGMSLADDIQHLGEGDDVARWTKTIADGVSMVGGLMCLFPPLAPLGLGLQLIAGAVSMIAGLFIESDEHKDMVKRRANERDNLKKSGALDDRPADKRDAIAALLTTDDGIRVLHAAQDAGLAAWQIRELASTQPFQLEGSWFDFTVKAWKALQAPGLPTSQWMIAPEISTLWGFLGAYDPPKFKDGLDRALTYLGPQGWDASPSLGLYLRPAFSPTVLVDKSHQV